eukprot:CAMPEP_0168718390 /NCGR_PEP_ID=MMETSP0724-20121128/492_1 /TAXON_ID=265536 /ORGANISM="Amphiprora sp., Strain CCMP467" /LENGTH=231 /DNA_ID=CAMNT_0008764899 /DNA_START=306 /DNA_END=998 /DNA_ORIENTATION=+
MNSSTNFIVTLKSPKIIPKRGYNKWRSLSRYKLDIFLKHIQQGERLVWTDVDTLVLTDLTPAMERNISWGVGWENGITGLTGGKRLHVYSRVKVEPSNQIQGDLWTLNLQGIKDVLLLEKEQVENNIAKPVYDLQGYFSILMSNGWPNFHLIQHLMPDYSFGFQCSGFKHPNKETFKPKVINGELICPDSDGIGLGSKVGAMSFTAHSFKKMILRDPVNFSAVSDEDSRQW